MNSGLFKFLNLVLYRANSELRSEATRTYAGYLWWILEPLMSLVIYYVAFKYIFHRETPHFALFLFIGIVLYRFFAGTVTRSATSISGSTGLIQLVYIHKSIFPLSVVMVNLVKFMVTFLLVLIITWLVGIPPSWAYLALPGLVALILLTTVGASMICAAITPFFPDFRLILDTIMHLLVFLSGIFFDIGNLSPSMQAILRLNPIAAIIEQFRSILLYGRWPELKQLVPALIISGVFLAVGWLLIHRFNRNFPKIG